MGDGGMQTYRLGFGGAAWSLGPRCRSHAARIGVHQHPNELMGKVDFMGIVGHEFETHGLPAKGPADDAQPAAPANVAAGRNAARAHTLASNDAPVSVRSGDGLGARKTPTA